MENVFQILNAVNVNEHTEKKNNLTYLSWAWAWAEVKKAFPEATYTVYERETATGPVNYFTDGRTCWVKTGVSVAGVEHIEELPVMDYKNKSIPAESVTSTDVNKSIQRSLTKACARHGLGLYIYAGEDLPEEETAKAAEAPPKREKGAPAACRDCGAAIEDAQKRNGESWPAEQIVIYSTRRFGRPLCPACQKKAFAAEKAGGREE